MVNPVLHCTSWCMVVVHGFAIREFQGPLVLQWCYLCGPLTSVWNHGTTTKLAMFADRIMMHVGCMIDFYFMSTLALSQSMLLLFSNLAAITAYVGAKWIAAGMSEEGKADISPNPFATTCHITSHAMVSFSHYNMLYFMHQNRSEDDMAAAEGFTFTRSLVLAAGFLPLVMYIIHVRKAS